MGAVIGDILPLALGIAISPIPIIAAILMLLSPQAKGTSLGFLVGWLLGIVVAVVVFTLLSSVLPDADADESKPIAGTIKIVLGALLLVMAVRQWRSRPQGDVEPPLPKWMAAIDTMTSVRALVLGFLLSGLNPKNLLMGVAAGVAIGSSGVTASESAVAITVFTVIAVSTVAVPVIAYLVAAAKMATPLEVLRQWLVHNNSTVMAVLLLVIGVVLIGKGIGSF
ncbi:GAP family protein [Microbacterium sp. 3J1]|uniref:GAP family protein n=1 Tax=Microbacterium sp. 3J1 TaxID=861269 RepID=UPI000A4B7AB1|nr:GAP family protein [Microbacterium sp. 3J1]